MRYLNNNSMNYTRLNHQMKKQARGISRTITRGSPIKIGKKLTGRFGIDSSKSPRKGRWSSISTGRKSISPLYRDRLVPGRISAQNLFSITERKITHKMNSYQRALSATILKSTSSVFSKPIKPLHLEDNFCKISKKNHKRPSCSNSPYMQTRIAGWDNNFYTNLLDWSYNNYIGVGFKQTVVIMNPSLMLEETGIPKLHLKIMNKTVNSVAFDNKSTKIAVGASDGSIWFLDYAKGGIIRNYSYHSERIGWIDWKDNVVFTGSKDCNVALLDDRTSGIVKLFQQHYGEVCGVKYKNNLLASGGNDNKVCINDLRTGRVLDFYEHSACVRALCWDNPGNFLYSGGGCSDRRIQVWDSKSKLIERSANVGSQVCSLLYSKNTEELVVCTGFSVNEVSIWSSQLKRVSILKNQNLDRALYSSLSPDGQKLVTGSGNGQIQFWRVFPSSDSKSKYQYEIR